jgi:hypothetical protein
MGHALPLTHPPVTRNRISAKAGGLTCPVFSTTRNSKVPFLYHRPLAMPPEPPLAIRFRCTEGRSRRGICRPLPYQASTGQHRALNNLLSFSSIIA